MIKTRKSCDTVIFYVCHTAFFANITLLRWEIGWGGGEVTQIRAEGKPGKFAYIDYKEKKMTRKRGLP